MGHRNGDTINKQEISADNMPPEYDRFYNL